ncbi:hypothetical protein KFE25_011424 [Diacronema lutheri]|uniref:Uncharacterized protein n=1 Tax=Diacronema lutheri TaxID=2081491 RepID=A0A8J5XAR5_DIALT|nr:hypothetical protein KFE25_011424 [Diacronema lutheri]
MGCALSRAGDDARVGQKRVEITGAQGAPVAATALAAAGDAPSVAAVGADGVASGGAAADDAQHSRRELEVKLSLIRDAVGDLPGIDVEMIKACLHEQHDDVERAVNVLLDGSYAASLAGARGGGGRGGWRWRGGGAKHGEHAVGASGDNGVWTSHLHIQTGRRYFHNHAAPGAESVWQLPLGAVADVVDDEEVIELAEYIDELTRELRARSPAASATTGRAEPEPFDPPEPVASILANLDYSTSIRLAMHQSRRHAAALAKAAPGAADASTPRAHAALQRAAAESSSEVRFLRHAERFPLLRVEQLAVDGQHAAVFRSADAALAGAGAGACTDVCVSLAIALLNHHRVHGGVGFARLLGGDGGAAGAGGAGEPPLVHPAGGSPHAIAGGALGGALQPSPLRARALADATARRTPHSPPRADERAGTPPPFRELRRLVASAIRTGTRVYDAQGDNAQMHYVEEALRLARVHGVDGAERVHKQRADILFNLPLTCDDAQPLSLDAFCAALRDAAERARAAPVCAIIVAERTAWTVMLALFADCALCIDPHGSEGQAVVVALRGPTDDLVRMSAEALQLVSMRPLYPTFESPAQPRVWLDPAAGQTELTLLALKPQPKPLLS